ncbi:MAG: neutral/alkaline non-lysosomal ceramidase N-terminal domain-containing protein [Thermoguttaceae bacterium]|jgi:hypothetical protein|nr:neutral/alkaline non-lysosomal ceramidase N-terminal domain-containing protein [Thermoguttaceae bacterium]
MKAPRSVKYRRREFLASLTAGSAGLLAMAGRARAGRIAAELLAGEGVVDTTPPLGIELGGFHRAPGNERRVRGIRQPTAARALVLKMGDSQAAILSIDIATVSEEFTRRVQDRVARQTGIPAENVRVCATHTHSMPAFNYLRQWGAIPVDYMNDVETKCVEAVVEGQQDLAPAKLSLGKSRAVGANHNRTTKSFKTDEHFAGDSTDQQRWLDTMLHVLLFERPGERRNLLWYHFSAHVVCYADEQAGPDWPGTVAERVREKFNLSPSYLQGHAGDVNPGDGDPWRGDIDKTTNGVFDAICRAMDTLQPVPVDRLVSRTRRFQVPLDMTLFESWREQYRNDAASCVRGPWVDAGFAEDWYRGNADRNVEEAHLPISLSAMQLGPVGLVFHPAELYSVYGLIIRRDSPLSDTLVVGYADGIIGYLADPAAYQAGEYAAITVPKILDIPPFTPNAARETTAAVSQLLRETAG